MPLVVRFVPHRGIAVRVPLETAKVDGPTGPIAHHVEEAQEEGILEIELGEGGFVQQGEDDVVEEPKYEPKGDG